MLNRSRHATSSTRLGIGVIVSALFLSACSSSDDDSDGITDPVAGDEMAFAFVSGQTPTFDAVRSNVFPLATTLKPAVPFRQPCPTLLCAPMALMCIKLDASISIPLPVFNKTI